MSEAEQPSNEGGGQAPPDAPPPAPPAEAPPAAAATSPPAAPPPPSDVPAPAPQEPALGQTAGTPPAPTTTAAATPPAAAAATPPAAEAAATPPAAATTTPPTSDTGSKPGSKTQFSASKSPVASLASQVASPRTVQKDKEELAEDMFQRRDTRCAVEGKKEAAWCRKMRKHYDKFWKSNIFQHMEPVVEPRCKFNEDRPVDKHQKRHFPAKHLRSKWTVL